MEESPMSTVTARRLLPISSRRLKIQEEHEEPDLRRLVGLKYVHEQLEMRVFADPLLDAADEKYGYIHKRRLSRRYQDAYDTSIEDYHRRRSLQTIPSQPVIVNKKKTTERRASVQTTSNRAPLRFVKIEDNSFNGKLEDKMVTLFIDNPGEYTASIKLVPQRLTTKASSTTRSLSPASAQKSQHTWVKGRSPSTTPVARDTQPAEKKLVTSQQQPTASQTKQNEPVKFKAVVRLSFKSKTK